LQKLAPDKEQFCSTKAQALAFGHTLLSDSNIQYLSFRLQVRQLLILTKSQAEMLTEAVFLVMSNPFMNEL
jgi:hypothetical protein